MGSLNKVAESTDLFGKGIRFQGRARQTLSSMWLISPSRLQFFDV